LFGENKNIYFHLNMTSKIKYCIFLIALLAVSAAAKAEFSGKIFNKSYPRDTLIHLGPCLVGDSLKTTFILENTGTEALMMGQTAYTIYLGKSEGESTQDEWREFKHVAPSIPYTIEPERKRDSIVIRYLADDNLLEFPYGQKHAYLRLALAKYFDETQAVASASYTILARKTRRYVDGFESVIDFDSVYIDPAQPKIFNWKIKNCWTSPVLIDSGRFTVLSPQPDGPEFSAEAESGSFTIGPDMVLPNKIGYTPKHSGEGRARMEYFYRPHPEIYPDSVDTARVEIYGAAVYQDIRPVASSADINGDTIACGNVRIGAEKKITIELENFGNLPFGCSGQYIYEAVEDTPSDNFSIDDEFQAGGGHLYPGENSTFSVRCRPRQTGVFIARLIIESDIKKRSIYGAPAGAGRKIIWLKARGIRPIAKLPADSINFGNVVRSLQCPGTADTTINIFNAGNENLIVSHIDIQPPNNFGISRRELEIAPNSSASVTLSFSPDDFADYSATASFITNEAAGRDTMPMVLTGSGVPLVKADLMIPADTAAPGTIVSIPIILKDGNARYAQKFSDTIQYDYSLLRFRDVSTIGTAAEGAIAVNIDEFYQPGRLPVYIELGYDRYFPAKDTIILLQFKAFLGERITAPISFTDPKFGDDKCEQVLSIEGNTRNGSFTIDSVCGIGLKTHKTDNAGFDMISPNPASGDINITFKTAFESRIKLGIYDSYGRMVKQIINRRIGAGAHSAVFNAAAIPPGVYYCRLRSGIMDRVRIITIVR
jgi:hypothetical protein